MTIGTTGQSAGCAGILAVAAAVANWNEQLWKTPRPIIVQGDMFCHYVNTQLFETWEYYVQLGGGACTHCLSVSQHCCRSPTFCGCSVLFYCFFETLASNLQGA